jgi:hypothetical protein
MDSTLNFVITNVFTLCNCSYLDRIGEQHSVVLHFSFVLSAIPNFRFLLEAFFILFYHS